MLLFEMANSHPSIEEIRSAYRDYMLKQEMKVKDDNLKSQMKKDGINVEELNAAIDSGEFNTKG